MLFRSSLVVWLLWEQQAAGSNPAVLSSPRKLGPDRKAERPKQAGVGRIFVMRYHAARRKRRASGKNGMDGPALPAVAGMDVEPAYISHESVSGSLAQLVGRILACRGKAAKAAESAVGRVPVA